MIDIINIVIQIIVGCGLIWIGKTANEIYKQQTNFLENQLSDWEKESIKENYHKISKALAEIERDGSIISPFPEYENHSLELIWKAKDDAKLCLPKEIKDYTNNLFKKIKDLQLILHKLNYLEIGEERNDLCSKKASILKQLSKENPNEIYSKCLKRKI